MAIYPCRCEHNYQDSKHGKGNRVFNLTMKKDYRCTVCGELRKEGRESKKSTEKGKK